MIWKEVTGTKLQIWFTIVKLQHFEISSTLLLTLLQTVTLQKPHSIHVYMKERVSSKKAIQKLNLKKNRYLYACSLRITCSRFFIGCCCITCRKLNLLSKWRERNRRSGFFLWRRDIYDEMKISFSPDKIVYLHSNFQQYSLTFFPNHLYTSITLVERLGVHGDL